MPVKLVDKNVGNRIRARRIEIRMACETLAAKLGLIREQIELWEAGLARVPPSLLLDIASNLGTDASYFFKTGPELESSDNVEENEMHAVAPTALRAPTRQDLLLVQAFSRIKSQDLRDSVVRLTECLATQG